MSEINDAAGALPEQPHTSEIVPELVTSGAESDVATKISAGQMLHTARLASGMHIGALSLALKVPVKKLEALEADDWTQLPDAVFVRALATSVCRQIKTDSAPILAALPQNKSFRDIDQGSKVAIHSSFRSPSDSKWTALRRHLSMPMVVSAMVLLLAAILLVFLPDFAQQQVSKKTEVIEKIESVATPEPVAVAVGMVVSAPAPILSASAPHVSTPVAPKPAPFVSAVPPLVTLPAGMSILRLAAKGEVWVQVKDSKGVVLVQRNLQRKEIVNVSGIPPLSVVLGRVNEIESVVVRGMPFDLASVASENVARFEVK